MKKQIIPLSLAVLFLACSNKSKQEAENSDNTGTEPAATQTAPASDMWRQSAEGVFAKIYTPKGMMVCQLEYKKTPVTVASFVGLSEGKIKNNFREQGKPFFDGLTFHRVEPGFVIQGGDPDGNGNGGPGYEFINEYDPSLKHDAKGTLAMANAGPGTNGSQFYLSLNPLPSLDGGNYTVFGHTVAGLDVLDRISKGDRIDSIRIERIGADAQAYDAVPVCQEATSKGSIYPKKTPQEMIAMQLQQRLRALEKERDQYAAAWDKKVKAKFPKAKKTASGLYYLVEKQGSGEQAQLGKMAVMQYTGTLWDGTVFDSSIPKGQPFSFALGYGEVILGWDEGVSLMKIGTKMKLIIPTYLGYGNNVRPGGPIPPGADLIFDVELVGMKSLQ